MDLAVLMDDVSKSFGDVKAVSGLSLEVEEGMIFGLLGPNGSGKSTTMRMIMGLIRPDSGRVSVYGIDVLKDPLKVRRLVGYVPETPRLYEFLTGIEYLDFVADVYGISPREKKDRIEEFLEAFGLKGREGEMISGYSHGMKQKLAIIASLIHRPKLLILDEPLSGIDPKSARMIKDLIKRLSKDGVTTILSTHILEIADVMCDRVAVMHEGVKVAEGTPTKLRAVAGMPGSTLEDVFLKLTKAKDMAEFVKALSG